MAEPYAFNEGVQYERNFPTSPQPQTEEETIELARRMAEAQGRPFDEEAVRAAYRAQNQPGSQGYLVDDPTLIQTGRAHELSAAAEVAADRQAAFQYDSNPGRRLSRELLSTQRDIIDAGRENIEEDFAYADSVANRNFDREQRNIEEDYQTRLAGVNSEIGEKQGELATAEKSYRLYMDAIIPGFAEAVDQAEKAAKATAAIEATFDQAQANVDDAYASASGRTRAIAAKVAGAGNAQVAQALTDTVYEMKEFIDRQISLDRNQTLTMHEVAANLAAAAAEAELASFQGEGTREIYKVQGQYESVLSNLVRQRSALNVGRQRALRNLDEMRSDYREGRDRELGERLDEYDDLTTEMMSANATYDQWMQSGFTLWFKDLADTDLEVPRTEQEFVLEVSDLMRQYGYTSVDQVIERVSLEQQRADQYAQQGLQYQPQFPLLPAEELARVARWDDQIEIGAKLSSDLERFYNEDTQGSASTTQGLYAGMLSDLMDMGVDRANAELLVQQRLGLDFLGG